VDDLEAWAESETISSLHVGRAAEFIKALQLSDCLNDKLTIKWILNPQRLHNGRGPVSMGTV